MNSILKVKLTEDSREKVKSDAIQSALNDSDGIMEVAVNAEQGVIQITYVADTIAEKDLLKKLEEQEVEIEAIIGEGGYS